MVKSLRIDGRCAGRERVYDWTEYEYDTDVMLDLRRTVDYERLVTRLDDVSPGRDTRGV